MVELNLFLINILAGGKKGFRGKGQQNTKSANSWGRVETWDSGSKMGIVLNRECRVQIKRILGGPLTHFPGRERGKGVGGKGTPGHSLYPNRIQNMFATSVWTETFANICEQSAHIRILLFSMQAIPKQWQGEGKWGKGGKGGSLVVPNWMGVLLVGFKRPRRC